MTGRTDAPKPENRMGAQMELDIDGVVFLVNHNFSGTLTIQEIYEDFLSRKLKNTA